MVPSRGKAFRHITPVECMRAKRTKPPPANPPSPAGCQFSPIWKTSEDSERDFVQADILDCGPDNGQATILSGEDINLIGALPDIAEETLDGI